MWGGGGGGGVGGQVAFSLTAFHLFRGLCQSLNLYQGYCSRLAAAFVRGCSHVHHFLTLSAGCVKRCVPFRLPSCIWTSMIRYWGLLFQELYFPWQCIQKRGEAPHHLTLLLTFDALGDGPPACQPLAAPRLHAPRDLVGAQSR